jgi:hypothetical protein
VGLNEIGSAILNSRTLSSNSGNSDRISNYMFTVSLRMYWFDSHTILNQIVTPLENKGID